jgi:hypothetical protein
MSVSKIRAFHDECTQKKSSFELSTVWRWNLFPAFRRLSPSSGICVTADGRTNWTIGLYLMKSPNSTCMCLKSSSYVIAMFFAFKQDCKYVLKLQMVPSATHIRSLPCHPLLPHYYTVLLYTRKCNFTYGYKRSVPFPAPSFTKLINAQHHYVQICCTVFHQWKIRIEILLLL